LPFQTIPQGNEPVRPNIRWSYVYQDYDTLVPVREQPFRFFDFGEILPRGEIDEDRREHLGYRPCSATCAIKARKSKCAAQLESFCLLASGVPGL
jgi:hypothetical protein